MQALIGHVARATVAIAAAALLAACSDDKLSVDQPSPTNASCPALLLGAVPAQRSLPVAAPAQMSLLGAGLDTMRYTSEVATRGGVAYTSTWFVRHSQGNKVNVWDVTGATPILIDSLIIPNVVAGQAVTTTGDVQISDDGQLLMVATERQGGMIALFSLADPRHPTPITQYHSANTDPGVHTAKFGRVNGKLYGFLSIDPIGTIPARLVIVDLSIPASPAEVFVKTIGNPYVHDTFIRDGVLFLAIWDDGIQMWDIGGCGLGGTPSSPVVVGGLRTVGGEAHNIWWYHDPTNDARRYVFVGEEGPGSIGSTSVGDIHVVDISDPAKMREVAFYHVDGAGTHNFSVDEPNGVLYAAYYNAGVRALDIRGDLGDCPTSQQESGGLHRCDLRLMGREIATGLTTIGKPVYVWGVAYLGGRIYASDMLSGLYVLKAAR